MANHQGWTFLSNHAHVLLCLKQNPNIRVRDLASNVGITERTVHHILDQLEEEGFVERVREGRRNHYELRLDQPLRHPLESHRTVADLIRAVVSRKDE